MTGVLRGGAARSGAARAAAAGRRVRGAAPAAPAGRGRASVPTGVTFPSMAKPQFSSLAATFISVSGTQCMRVTISVWPFRRAQAMNVVSDALVQPILPPRSPR